MTYLLYNELPEFKQDHLIKEYWTNAEIAYNNCKKSGMFWNGVKCLQKPTPKPKFKYKKKSK